MSVKYKGKYNVEKHDHAVDLAKLYRDTFYDVVDSRHATSKVVLDPEGALQLSAGDKSEMLDNISKIVGIVPVAGTIASGVVGGVSALCGMYHIHQTTAHAKHFLKFVNNCPEDFDDFVNKIAQNVTDKHEHYISTLVEHQESMTWIKHSIVAKLENVFKGNHNEAEKLVVMLATAHAKMMIKHIEHTSSDHEQLKHAISETFADDHHAYCGTSDDVTAYHVAEMGVNGGNDYISYV